MRRSTLTVIGGILLVGALGVASGRLTPAPPSFEAATVADQPAISDSGFARIVERLSEPGGYFDSDNLISNEASYLHVIGALGRHGVEGGAYVGVGPDQNFSYIAQIRPRLAIIIDIRRDNMLQHLLFKALFGMSRNRVEFLSLLFGRPAPPNAAAWSASSAEAMVDWLEGERVDSARFAATRNEVRRRVLATGIPLDSADLAKIARNHAAFVTGGPSLQFTSSGRPPRPYYPTYRRLMLETDLDGRQSSYLASEAAFEFVRALQENNLVIPVVGDLAGEHAVREIGRFLRERHDTLSAFYTSNVEFYLVRNGQFDEWARNVETLPRNGRSVIIRSYFGGYYGGAHPAAVPGYFSTQLMQSMNSFVKEFDSGGYGSYFDVISKHLLPLR
jgi:hypothetical protein